MNWLTRMFAPPQPTSVPEGALLIDVRSRGEFASGHIDGSINLPLDRLAAEIASVAPDKATPLVLCCASGARSASARAFLHQQGYAQVSNGGGVGGLAMSLGRPIRRA
jgi:phage shock protein E